MKNADKTLVSIHCITYNQKDYIRQCLDGFVMQKTNFKFVAYVGDDCSTDGTTEIVREYEQKYPYIIKGIYHSENTGGEQNYFDVANMCKTKYVAICEGDDYWTDPYKLQKQVDFLESHPDCSICFHPVNVIYDGFDFEKQDEIYPNQEMENKGFTFENLLNINFIQTNSVMYRWRFNDLNIQEYFPENILPGDWYLHLLHAKVGKIGYLPEVMSVYRRNPNGIWQDELKSSVEELHLKYGIKELKFYYSVYKNIVDNSDDYLFNKFIPELQNISFTYLKYKQFNELKIITELYSSEFAKMLELVPTHFEYKNLKSEYQKISIKYNRYKNLFNITLIVSIIIFVLLLIFIFL